MNGSGIRWLSMIWSSFFPKDNGKKLSIKDDPRLNAINSFYSFFTASREGKTLLKKAELFDETHLHFDIKSFCSYFDDFDDTLRNQPTEVIGCIGLALSLVPTFQNERVIEFPYIIHPVFYHMNPIRPFGELRSNSVGQFVAIRGYVIRVTPCKPLIIRASFLCGKCLKTSDVYFEDGIFQPPEICHTDKCRTRFLEIQRRTVLTSDFQRIKLQELDSFDDHSARIPRTFEVELRGHLVDSCISGDIVEICGIIQTAHTEVKTCLSSFSFLFHPVFM